MEYWSTGQKTMLENHYSNTPLLHYSSLQSRHPGEHSKQNCEILIREPHTARGRKHLVSYRRGWQWHIELAAHFQRQQQIFLHHVDVEPRLVRHIEYERAAVLDHR